MRQPALNTTAPSVSTETTALDSVGLFSAYDATTHRYGYIDKTGAWVIGPTGPYPPFFAYSFSHGLCQAQDQSGKSGYVDKTGAWAIPPTFGSATSFRNGLAFAAIGMGDPAWGMIDKTGFWAIRPQFSFGQPFFDGLALVGIRGEAGGHWAYIDKTGRVIWRSASDEGS